SLRGAVVIGDLTGVDLTRADLAGADLSAVTLDHACLRQANLREARLEAADLTGADLTGADLTGVVYDEDTTWPTHFHQRQDGAILVVSGRRGLIPSPTQRAPMRLASMISDEVCSADYRR